MRSMRTADDDADDKTADTSLALHANASYDDGDDDDDDALVGERRP